MNNKSKVPMVPRGRFAPTIPSERRRRKQLQVDSQDKTTDSPPVEQTRNESTKKTLEGSTLKTENKALEQPIKKEPLIQTTNNETKVKQNSNTCLQLDSSDEEQENTRDDNYNTTVGYNVTYGSSSLLPVVLPISNQPTDEFGQVDNTEHQKGNLAKKSIASKLCHEKKWFFVQLPPTLPISDSIEMQQKDLHNEKEETVDESASTEAKLRELKYMMSQNEVESQLHPDIRHMKSCKLGSLRIFRSGKVELVINGMTCEVLQGAETSFLEKAMQVDWEKSLLGELGDVSHRWICVPNVDNHLHWNGDKVCNVQSSFMKEEEKMLWKTE